MNTLGLSHALSVFKTCPTNEQAPQEVKACCLSPPDYFRCVNFQISAPFLIPTWQVSAANFKMKNVSTSSFPFRPGPPPWLPVAPIPPASPSISGKNWEVPGQPTQPVSKPVPGKELSDKCLQKESLPWPGVNCVMLLASRPPYGVVISQGERLHLGLEFQHLLCDSRPPTWSFWAPVFCISELGITIVKEKSLSCVRLFANPWTT